tara:strand:+ start:18 stop:3626 length:3609 start_codon:yes stop_codon:yes gene_type:complete
MTDTISYEEFEELFNAGRFSGGKKPNNATPITISEDNYESDIPEGNRLKKKDLYSYKNLNTIRNYMSRSKGVDYKTAEPEKVVEDFVDHMRYFNSNAISTAGEVIFVSRGSDEDKYAANQAYKLYDSLGNVFVNDGFYGAVDGVKDYMYSAVTDPTNYIGALTGGFGRLAAAGINQSSRAAVKRAAAAASLRSVRSGATREAAKKAGKEAAEEMAKKMIGNSVKKGAIEKQSQRVADEAYRTVISKAASKGADDFIKDKFKKAGKRAVAYTTAADALLAGVQADAIQSVYLDVGAQEKYNHLDTAFSTLLGGVGGGLHYAFGKFEGKSGLGTAMQELNAASRAKEQPLKIISNLETRLKKLETSKAPKKEISELKSKIRELKKKRLGPQILNDEGQKAAEKIFKDNLESWAAKVGRGEEALGSNRMPEGMLHEILFGADGNGGLQKIFIDNGIKVKRGKSKTTVSDMATNIIRHMDQDYLQDVSQRMYRYTNIHLGDLDSFSIDIGDIMAANISKAAGTVGMMGQFRRAIDGGVVSGNEILKGDLLQKEVRDSMKKEFALARKAKPFTYGQNIWKRLLVSSPATTAANVFGFGQFFIGQSVADILTGGQLYLAGTLLHGGGKTKEGKELIRKAAVYKQIQAQKMLNLLDPFTTRQAYLEFLDKHKDVKGLLHETVGAAVERGGERYGLDKNNTIIYGKLGVENFTNAAMNISGVRAQDSFTKSTMFMTEMDKYLRLKYEGRTLLDVLKKGDLELIDDDVIGGALDTTMRSVFSKDYTTKDGSQRLGELAKIVENFSNLPGFGTILPFGRFFNNVIATAYQWSPLSFLPAAARMVQGEGIKAQEALSRSVVGAALVPLAMYHSQKQEEKNLAYNEVEVGGGTIVDVRNVFPFSLFLAVGRVLNLRRKGEVVSKKNYEDMAQQLAVGQLARDVQFSNTLYSVADVMLNADAESSKSMLEAFYKAGGGFMAGFTRPLDAANRAVGFVFETDTIKDPRQARGSAVFTQQASKYFDNIFEAFIGETDNLTGEKLRVATRTGDLYDVNPLARIFGLTVKRGKTASEQAYSMAEMQVWTADSRTKMPQYDRVFNSVIAPMLEVKMQKLVESKKFKEADVGSRRGQLKSLMSQSRDIIRDHLDATSGSDFMSRMRYLASKKGTKDHKAKAKKYMKNKFGITARLEDYSFRELNVYNSYIDHLKYLDETNF